MEAAKSRRPSPGLSSQLQLITEGLRPSRFYLPDSGTPLGPLNKRMCEFPESPPPLCMEPDPSYQFLTGLVGILGAVHLGLP